MREAVPLAAVVFVVCLAVYDLNGKSLPEVDVVAPPYAAWSIVRHGSPDLSRYPVLDYLRPGGVIREARRGQWLGLHQLGNALAMTPFVAPFALAREEPLPPRQMIDLGKLAASCFVAGAVAILFLLLDRVAPAARWPATLLFAFGTTAWSVASQAFWSHAPALFWVASAMLFLLAPSGRRAWASGAAGFAFGMAVLTRSTTFLLPVAVAPALLAQARWKEIAAATLGGSLPVAVLLWSNLHYFGDPLLGAYPATHLRIVDPLWGTLGLLIAPSRGLFFYSPALIAAPAGVWMLRRRSDLGRDRALVPALFAGALLTVTLYGATHWWGGWCYGPRYLTETMPIWALLFGIAYSGLPSRWYRGVAWALVGVSVFVHLAGVFGRSAYADWNRRNASDARPQYTFSLADTQIEAHARALLGEIKRATGLSGSRATSAAPASPPAWSAFGSRGRSGESPAPAARAGRSGGRGRE